MKIRRFVSAIVAVLVIASPGNAFCCDESEFVSKQGSLTEKLVDTAGEVLLEAAEFGLDWAGEKLLGTRGWKGFKRILSPVVARLQKEFPEFRFGRRDDPAAAEAARQAVEFLKGSPELHDLLSEGFMSLQEGQGEILASMDRMEKLMTAQHEEQMKLTTQMSEQISDGGALPRRVDVSEIADRLYVMSKLRARREGREFNDNVVGLVATSAAVGLFCQRVLEQGDAFVRYESNISNGMWYAKASAVFTDEGGRPCRKIATDSPVWGEPGKRRSDFSKYCQVEGIWNEIELLERREYIEEQDAGYQQEE